MIKFYKNSSTTCIVVSSNIELFIFSICVVFLHCDLICCPRQQIKFSQNYQTFVVLYILQYSGINNFADNRFNGSATARLETDDEDRIEWAPARMNGQEAVTLRNESPQLSAQLFAPRRRPEGYR